MREIHTFDKIVKPAKLSDERPGDKQPQFLASNFNVCFFNKLTLAPIAMNKLKQI